VEKIRSFGAAFGQWAREETPDPVIADGDRREVDAAVTRICRDPIVKPAYGLPDPGSWDRLTIHFFRGNRCYVEMFFNDGFAYYVHLLKYQGKWEVLFIGCWIN